GVVYLPAARSEIFLLRNSGSPDYACNSLSAPHSVAGRRCAKPSWRQRSKVESLETGGIKRGAPSSVAPKATGGASDHPRITIERTRDANSARGHCLVTQDCR